MFETHEKVAVPRVAEYPAATSRVISTINM